MHQMDGIEAERVTRDCIESLVFILSQVMPQLSSVSIAHYTGRKETHYLFLDTLTLEKDTDEVVQTDDILAMVFLELGSQLFILVLILSLT